MAGQNEQDEPRYGVRILPIELDEGRVRLFQTILRDAEPAPPRRYVTDTDEGGNPIARFINIEDDHELAEAVRAAFRGELGNN